MKTDIEIPEEDEQVAVTRLMRISLLSFLLSLIIGSVIFFAYQARITDEWDIILTFFIYFIIAFFVNTIILINLFIGACLFKAHRTKLLLRCGLLLLNWPIAIYYFLTVINFKPI